MKSLEKFVYDILVFVNVASLLYALNSFNDSCLDEIDGGP